MAAKQSIAYFFIFIFLSSFSLISTQSVDNVDAFFISIDQEMETEEKAEEGSDAVEEMLYSVANHFFGFDNFACTSHHVHIVPYSLHLKVPDIPPEVSSFS